MSTEAVKNATSNVRPRQVLLVGLGGVGSRMVDAVLEVMPKGYLPYTKAIAVDTDVEELDIRLHNIPVENRIALGADPDNGQSITVGEYIRNHPDTMNWFVKGEHLHTIKNRNTTQGAKQVRMVSRIALAATNEMCGMRKRLENILQDLNRADGTTLSRGILVLVVCSVAGGTGAGTVLQFPLYLEQVLSEKFADDNVQMECAMLLPNMFARAQDPENQMAARANAYAVIRELMSMNSGRLTRGDILPDCDFGERKEHVSPYGRIMFFDDISMSGDTIEPDLDNVFVPKTASALNEYLFGPVSGKITSALDNTLARVYRTKGTSIFSSVGMAKFMFPRMSYTQYAIAKWVTKVISTDWRYPDEEVDKQYAEMLRSAIENNTDRPDKVSEKRKLYRSVIDAKTSAFYREIKNAYYVKIDDEPFDLATLFWDNCDAALRAKISQNSDVINQGKILMNNAYDADARGMKDSLEELSKVINGLIPLGHQFEIDVMRPMEAKTGTLYTRDDDEKHLFTFLKKAKLHPIMLRYFLYALYERAQEEATLEIKGDEMQVDLEGIKGKKALTDRANNDNATLISRGQSKIVQSFAKHLVADLEQYIHEIEDMFKSLNVVVERFEQIGRKSLQNLTPSNPRTGIVLAGGKFSMMYTWKQIEQQIGGGEDIYTVDDEMNIKLHELIYKAFYDQVSGTTAAQAGEFSSFRVRTRYEGIVTSELQQYYGKLMRDRYANYFPANVLEAALWECGLINAYHHQLAGMEPTVRERFTPEIFIARGAAPLNFGAEDKNIPDGCIRDDEYLSARLSEAIGNSKPYCGKIDDSKGDRAMINRLEVANEGILRSEADPQQTDAFGVAKQVLIEDFFIDGVSTSRIGGCNLNAKFVADGISVDEIKYVTTIAGLQPFQFVAFLPPDDNEHAPSEEQTYYSAYRELIDNIAVSADCITPHLNCDWHLADRLDDFTTDHTNTYYRSASKAFIYGFIFDVIRVGDGGVVTIGKVNDLHFTGALGEDGIKDFALMGASIHSNFDDEEVLDGYTVGKKRDVINAILVKTYELLATSQPLRESIISYAEDELKKCNVSSLIEKCVADENVSHVTYNSILDMMDGYFQGTKQFKYAEEDRAIKNTKYMFECLLKEIYDSTLVLTEELSMIKAFYETAVHAIYDDAFCDDPPAEDLFAVGDFVPEEETPLQKLARLQQKVAKKSGSQNKPFSPDGRFSRTTALEMFNTFTK